jgi:hypothetical protein
MVRPAVRRAAPGSSQQPQPVRARQDPATRLILLALLVFGGACPSYPYGCRCGTVLPCQCVCSATTRGVGASIRGLRHPPPSSAEQERPASKIEGAVPYNTRWRSYQPFQLCGPAAPAMPMLPTEESDRKERAQASAARWRREEERDELSRERSGQMWRKMAAINWVGVPRHHACLLVSPTKCLRPCLATACLHDLSAVGGESTIGRRGSRQDACEHCRCGTVAGGVHCTECNQAVALRGVATFERPAINGAFTATRACGSGGLVHVVTGHVCGVC